ncbi:transporter [Lachnospiraceae bacterium KM106-2]|nr:transporter [Lachnospiraceae bacterium KM106-2]
MKKTPKQALILSICMILLIVGLYDGRVNASTELSKPTLKITQRTATTVKLSISSVKNADGYQIYRAGSKDGTYQLVKTTKKTSFVDEERSATKKYYYKVRAYKKTKSKRIYSSYSSKKGCTATLKKPANFKVSQSTETKIKISYKSVADATSYKIYRATSKNGTYQLVKTTSKKSYTDSKLTTGKTYYYKVRAYQKKNSIPYYGVFTAKKGITLKKKPIASTPSPAPTKAPTVTPAPTKMPTATKVPTPTKVPVATAVPTKAPTTSNSVVSEMLASINKERNSQGLSSLTTNDNLNAAATKRAKETVSLFSHTRPDGTSGVTVLKEYGISYQAWGENIAYGQRNVTEVMNSWMNSSGHRANILSSKFSKVGIGCYENNGTLYWTQVFMN